MLRVENISKDYGKFTALDGFTYDFSNGIHAILGPNGSGKSTLMNIITGNLDASRGNFEFLSGENKPMSDINIGYVPQYPAMYPQFTAYEMMDYMAILKKASNRKEQITELLEMFGLSEYSGKKIKALSGGTKQRLAIAQSLIGSPDLVIFDEPTAGLDPLQRIQFKNSIAKYKKETIIIISTHIVSDVEDIADKVIFLSHGRTVRHGTIDEVTKDLSGKCWSIPHTGNAQGFSLSRVDGNQVRIINETKPCEEAVSALPVLEDCYLNIFGKETV